MTVTSKLSGSVDIRDIHRLVDGLPIVTRVVDELNGILEFRPQRDRLPLLIDCSQVSQATAEAAAALIALERWLRGQSDAADDLVFKLPAWELLQLPKKSESKRRNGLILLPKNILIENTFVEKADPSVAATLNNSIEEIQIQLREYMALEPLRDSGDWIRELLTEGLLNVAQHSRSTAGGTSEAIVCAAISTKAPSEGSSAKQDSSSHQRHQGEASYLELSIIDIGIGIPQTLCKQYLSAVPTAKARINQVSGDARWRQLHTEVLRWAMSPFGTRKKTTERLNLWRGLYRVLHRTTKMSGQITLTSGYGRLESATDHSNKSNDQGETLKRGVPWTSLTAIIPLAPAHPIPSATTALCVGAADIAAQIAVTFRTSGSIPTMLDERGVEIYARNLSSDLVAAIGSIDTPEGRKNDASLLAIVHPSVVVLGDGYASSDDRFLASRSRDLLSEMIAKVLDATWVPGNICIHFFLDPRIDDEVLDRVQEYIYAKTTDRFLRESNIPLGLTAVYDPDKQQARLVFATTKPNTRAAQEAFFRSNLEDPTGVLWSRYTSYFPEIFSARISHLEFQPEVLNRLATAHLNGLVQRSLPKGGNVSPGSWYWKAPYDEEGRPTEAIEVARGKNVGEYISVPRLYSIDPVFARYIDCALLNAIRYHLRTATNIFISADREGSSYLLARRIQKSLGSELKDEMIGHGQKVRFWHPRDLRERASIIPVNSLVLIISDFRNSGDTLRACVESIRTLIPTGREVRLASWIAVDSNELVTSHPTEVFRYANYRTLGYLPETPAGRLKIDPVSHDFISPERQQYIHNLKSLSWQNSIISPSGQTSNADNSLVSVVENSAFRYGLQFMGGRHFFCRWPVHVNLSALEIKKAVGSGIARLIRRVIKPATKVIGVLIRRGSTIEDHIDELIEIVALRLDESRVRELSIRWAPIYVDDSYGRSISGAELTTALRRVLVASTQQTLFGEEESIPILGKVSLLFLDNSVVTGQTLTDLLVHVSSIADPYFHAIESFCYYPLVSRLSPTKELFFSNIALRRGPAGAESAIGEPQYIPVHFAAFVQIRVKSYKTPGEIPLVQFCEDLVENAQYDTNPKLREIGDTLAETVRTLRKVGSQTAQTAREHVLLSLYGAEDVGGNKCSADIVLLRQLVALQQQGIPCAEDIAGLVRRLAFQRPHDLIMMLALEPQLVRDTYILRDFSEDIAATCDRIIAAGASPSQVWNALSVRAQFPLNLERLVAAVDSRADDRELCSFMFVFLILYLPSIYREPGLIELAIAVLEDRRKLLTDTWDSPRLLLRAGRGANQPTMELKTKSSARAILINYLKTAHYKHGDSSAASWLEIRETFSTDAMLDELLVEKCRAACRWVVNDITLAFRAIRYLASAERHAERIRRELERRQLAVLRLTERLLDEVQRGVNDSLDLELARKTWGDLCDLTTNLCSDELMCRTDFVYMANAGEAVRDDRVANFAALLVRNVCEPVSLFVGTLKGTLPHATPLLATIEVGSLSVPGFSFHVEDDIGEIFRAIWRKGANVPVLWREDIQHFVELLGIAAQNIRKHGSAGKQVSLRAEQRIQPNKQVAIYFLISNLVDEKRTPGRRTGMPLMTQIAKRLGGTVTSRKESGTRGRKLGRYFLEISIVPQWIQLSEV